MEYIVDLDPEWDEVEDYQKDNDNLLDVRVYDKATNEELKNCYVGLYLSKNGMLGFGKALIRLAHKFHDRLQMRLDPLTCKDIAVERMGVWVHPESQTFSIRCEGNFGDVDEEIFSKFDDEKKLKK